MYTSPYPLGTLTASKTSVLLERVIHYKPRNQSAGGLDLKKRGGSTSLRSRGERMRDAPEREDLALSEPTSR